MIIKEGKGILGVRLQDGEDLMDSMKTVCKNYKIESGIVLSGIGMLREVEVSYWDGKEYLTELVKEPVELVSLQGNISTTENDGDPIIHIHVALGTKDHKMIGGHLSGGKVNSTGEVFIQKLENILLIRKKEKNGLMGLFPA